MSDLTALAEKITALAATDAVFDAGGRVISTAGDPAPLAAILKEIDEIVLEREVVITADDQRLHLIVAGRRLRGVAEAGGPKATAAVGTTLSREEPDLLQAVHDLLVDQCANAQRVKIAVRPPRPFGKGGERGVSALGLADIWDIDIHVAPQSPMERLLKTAATVGGAMLHMQGGEIKDRSGDITALQTILDTQWEAFQALQQKQGVAGPDPQFVSLEEALADGRSATLIVAGDDTILVAHDADAIAALHTAWKDMLG